jgi:Ca2+-binding RTX toxin-like protein
MTLPNLSIAIKRYLYGTDSVPDNFVDQSLIRPTAAIEQIPGVSAQEFMAGPGRFALASSFTIVGEFFDDVNGYDVTQLFSSQSGDEARLSKEQWANVLGLNAYSLSIDHKDFDDGQDSFSERVFLWGNTSFQISDAEFVVRRSINEDGSYTFTKTIENFAVLPRHENFDFVSSDGTTTQTQHVSQHAIDPSGIGRRVDIIFVDDVPRETLTEPDYWHDVSQFGGLGYSKFEYNLPRQFQLKTGTQAIFASLFSSGITAAASADKLVVYGTDDADSFSGWNTPSGINLLKQYESVGPYSFLMPQFQLALNGLVYVAGDGDDTITGTSKGDVIFGGVGADRLNGKGGDDFLFFDAQDTFVRGGTGHDTAIVATVDAVKVNLTTMQVESFVGNAGADTIAAGDAADAQFIAGGNGADIFRIGYGAGQGPRIVWGGEGVDRFYLMSPSGDAVNAATTPAGILAVTVAGLTAANFAGLTLAQLGLDSIDLSKIAAIVLNPEATDRFYVDGIRINETLLKNDPNLQANDGGSVFTTRDTPILGPDLDIQGVFQDRTLIVPQPNVSFFELGEADDEFFIEVNGARVDEGNWGVVWGDGISTDVLMTLDEAQSYIDNFVSIPYWSEPTDPRAYGSFFVAGGSFTGTALAASGGFTAPTPPDTGISDWLLAA